MTFKEPVIYLSQTSNAMGLAQSIAFKDTVTCLSQTNEVVCPGHSLERCGHLSQSDQQKKIR